MNTFYAPAGGQGAHCSSSFHSARYLSGSFPEREAEKEGGEGGRKRRRRRMKRGRRRRKRMRRRMRRANDLRGESIGIHGFLCIPMDSYGF